MAMLHAFATATGLEVTLHDGNDVVAVRGLEVLETEVVPPKAMGLSDHDGLWINLARIR
jgi:hypothetical protein